MEKNSETNILKDLYDFNGYRIVLDFDGTLLNTEKYFKKYQIIIKIVDLLYSIYYSKLEEYIDYRRVRKFLSFLTKFLSEKVCREYLSRENTRELYLLLHSLSSMKNKNFEIFILSKSKTAECLGLSENFFKPMKIPYFWVGKYKKVYLEVICRKKKCLLISDNEDEDIIRGLENVIFVKVNSPTETYDILNRLLYRV